MNRTGLPALLATAALVLSAEAAQAIPDHRDVVRTWSGDIVYNRFGECVRTKWLQAGDACAPEVAQAVRERRDIALEERTVYFGFNQASLTPDARQRLHSLAQVIRSERDVKEARIVGYADRIGTQTYNERLSQRRAENVRKYLVGQGVINTRVAETRWLGESVPKTNCPDTLSRQQLIDCLQRDRRVEVEIEYLPATAASNHFNSNQRR